MPISIRKVNIGIKNSSTGEYETINALSGEGCLNLKEASNLETRKLIQVSRQSRKFIDNPTAPLMLLHFSDIHGDTAALNRIIEDAAALGNPYTDAICTGDMVTDVAGQISSWWPENILTCIGSHDTASYTEGTGYNWTALSMADRDAYYISPFESNWGVTHTAGTSYYYKDYTNNNVRLIVMDAMLYEDENTTDADAQTAWLTSLLNGAITDGLHVLIAIHAPYSEGRCIECSFSDISHLYPYSKYHDLDPYGETFFKPDGSPITRHCSTPQVVVDTVKAAITSGLNFIGYISGNTHRDNVYDLWGDGKQYQYCVTCAAVADEEQWRYSDLIRNETMDAYNIIVIDTDNSFIDIIRCGGANVSVDMRNRKAIRFGYGDGWTVGEIY